MSILAKAQTVAKKENDKLFLIYGPPGSGKTTLAFSFPKTKDAPLLYIDVLEGGAGVLPAADKDLVVSVAPTTFKEFDEILSDVMQGYTIDDNGQAINVKYSTIVIDTLTNVEYLLKEFIKKGDNTEVMSLRLWGLVKDRNEGILNMLRLVYNKTGANIVVICHQKEEKNEENPTYAKLIPSLMSSTALACAAKMSYVWYTNVENDTVIDPKTNEAHDVMKYTTIIDTAPYVLSKCRKPKDIAIPSKVTNLTYDKFKKNVLDKL